MQTFVAAMVILQATPRTPSKHAKGGSRFPTNKTPAGSQWLAGGACSNHILIAKSQAALQSGPAEHSVPASPSLSHKNFLSAPSPLNWGTLEVPQFNRRSIFRDCRQRRSDNR